MATKILIPTPLRPFTDKQDAVDADGATVGELLADLTRKHGGLKAHLYNDQGKLRSFVNVYVNDEDIRYLQKEQTPVNAGRHDQHHPVGRRRRRHDAATSRTQATAIAPGADQRRSQALQPAPDHAGGRRRRAAQAEGGQRAVHRRGRPRLAGGDVSRRRRRRHDRHRRLRRRRLQQPAAADHSRHAGRRPLEARVGEGSAARAQPARRRSRPTRPRCPRRTRWSCSSRTTSSSTAPTTFRRAIS